MKIRERGYQMVKIKASLFLEETDKNLAYKTKQRDFYLYIPREGLIDRTEMDGFDYVKIDNKTFGKINWQFAAFNDDITII